jgi:hypothetical protein
MTLGTPINESQIREYLREVADELAPSGQQHVLVIVGGALLAWLGLREATRDVDSVVRFDDELADAVRAVAARHELAPAWVNHYAAAFLPQTFVMETCEVLMERGRLRVLGAPVRQVIVMKLFRGASPGPRGSRRTLAARGFHACGRRRRILEGIPRCAGG